MVLCVSCLVYTTAELTRFVLYRARDSSPEDAGKKLAAITENLEGEIRNPLKGIPQDTLFANVEEFQRTKGLPSDLLPLLQRGALVAQNPAAFESINELEEEEKQALREEVTHRWKHPWSLYYTIGLSSIAAAIQGWDQVSGQHSYPLTMRLLSH